jgi:SAM-dependent methyltransferase
VVVTSTEVVWHDLECGGYRADLSLWRELAEQSRDGDRPARILDVGAGTGRVTLDLARAGCSVTALDLDPELLAALRERVGDLRGEWTADPQGERIADPQIETVCADARSFELDRREFDLCLVPMQTLQLLRDSVERVAFLRCARAHLRPGGLLACAIVTVLDSFDCADGDAGPSPEATWSGETHYSSRATRVNVEERAVVIERERRIARPGIAPEIERNVVELDRIAVSDLEREAMTAGLRPAPAREIAPTNEHVGSTVAISRA